MNDLKEQILKLENSLLLKNIRKSPDDIEKLLAEDFVEFCSSGKVYYYKKGDKFETNIDIIGEIVDFSIKYLSDNTVLATYKLINYGEYLDGEKYTLRSSIWKLVNSSWKMVFHQGTIINEIG